MVAVDPNPRAYFVDEAGDGVLFDARGNRIVGSPGCSRFFILGVLDVADVSGLERDLAALRDWVVNDPYLARIPSVQKHERKTFEIFHAHDDAPEVRRAVCDLLLAHDLRFQAVVREKSDLLRYVESRNAVEPKYRYNPNELYDFLVRRLFRNLLHKDAAYRVTFAARGNRDRTNSLMRALESARITFEAKFGIQGQALIEVSSGTPRKCPPLQAADYFLWALQRLYERGEDRYVEFLWPKFKLVIEMDDTRRRGYGEYYDVKRPLNRAALRDRPGI